MRLLYTIACILALLGIRGTGVLSRFVSNLGFLHLVSVTSCSGDAANCRAMPLTAEEFHRYSVAAYPENRSGWYGLGWALELQGREMDAGVAWRNVPGIAVAFVERAQEAQRGGQRALAETWYRRALAVDPNNLIANAQLGRLLYETGEAVTAVDLLTKSVAAVPLDAMMQAQLCYALRASGQQTEALAHYHSAPDVVRRSASMHACVGKIHWDLGNYLEAYHHLAAAEALQPQDASLHFWLSLILNRLGQVSDAINQAEHAIELAPDHDDYACHLANLYHSNGQLERARGLLQKVLTSKPDSACAASSLVRMEPASER